MSKNHDGSDAGLPITSAVYPRGARKRKPAPAKPARQPRGTTVGELLDPHAASALVALRAELEREAKP